MAITSAVSLLIFLSAFQSQTIKITHSHPIAPHKHSHSHPVKDGSSHDHSHPHSHSHTIVVSGPGIDLASVPKLNFVPDLAGQCTDKSEYDRRAPEEMPRASIFRPPIV